MNHVLVVLPLALTLLTAAVSVLVWRNRRLQRRISVLSAGLLLAAACALLRAVWRHGIIVVQLGDWPAPFGITLVADTFSGIMVVLAGIIGFAVMVYSVAGIDARRQSFGYFPLLHVLLLGVCGAFLTGDIFNLYVWFEVMLMASFVLLVLGGERQQLEGAVKYVTLNLLSSAMFLSAVGILYGFTGTLNMADLVGKLATLEHPSVRVALAMLFLIAFGIKAAMFPLFFWLPASYHTPPAPVSAVFAGLLTKVGVYALIRVFTLLFSSDMGGTYGLITFLAGLTMVTGVLGATAQNDFRRILSFHIVSQIGYMIMGLGLLTAAALAGSIFYIMHHIIVKTNLFLVSGLVHHLRGEYALNRLGGLYRERPLLAFLFIIPAMSLAGTPPLSGFFAKFALVRAGLQIEQYAIVATALAVGLLTLYSMTKIWAEVFWKPSPESTNDRDDGGKASPPSSLPRTMLAPVIGLAAITLYMGAAAGPFFALATRAASELLDPASYARAVLGDAP